jgi:hypothetical protein
MPCPQLCPAARPWQGGRPQTLQPPAPAQRTVTFQRQYFRAVVVTVVKGLPGFKSLRTRIFFCPGKLSFHPA